MGTIVSGSLTAGTVLSRLKGKNGTHEYPAGSNRQMFGVWYGWNGVPWCAIFASWGFSGSTGQMGGKVAGVSTLRERFQAQGRYGSTPKVGALAIFNYDKHVEAVISIPDSTYVWCVGGNTSRPDGTNPWGGQVSIKKRRRSEIKGYCYPRYAGSTTSSTFVSGPTLYQGINSPTAVKRLQNALNKLVGAGLTVDGSFGAKTAYHTKRYQTKEGLSVVDARVGPTTQRHFYDDKYPIY